MPTDPEVLLRDAEELIEGWWCELDTAWRATVADAEVRAARVLDDARTDGAEMLEDARSEAAAIVAAARTDASRAGTQAQADAAEIVAAARIEADAIIAEANATAGEHHDVILALTTAEREAAGEELASLREAVTRLRTELSRLVDAAFDAFPAVEATADAIDRALGDERPEPEPEVVDSGPKRGRLRRLFRRS